jgi:hypothetical protein
MFHRLFISFPLLLWLSLSPFVYAARNSFESLYSGSGYALQTDSGSPPYSVAGRFVVSMRRSYFNVAGENIYFIGLSAIITSSLRLIMLFILQRWAVRSALAEVHRKTCAVRYAQLASMASQGTHPPPPPLSRTFLISFRFFSCVQPNNCVLPNLGDTVTLIPDPRDGVRTHILYSDGSFIENLRVRSLRPCARAVKCPCS